MTQNLSETRWNLVTAILAAFQLAKYPGDDQIVRNDPSNDYEAREARDHLVGKIWQHLGMELLEAPNDASLYYYQNVLFLLTPAAFCYYVPAFMIVSLDIVRSDVIGDTLLYRLSSDPFPNLNDVARSQEFEWHRQMTLILTAEQRKCINMLLRYLQQEFPDSSEQISGLDYAWLRDNHERDEL